jgi:hypothetical protein
VTGPQRRSGESNENLSADDVDRYTFNRGSLHFDARTALQNASIIAAPAQSIERLSRIQGIANGNTPFPASTSSTCLLGTDG